MLAEDLIAYSYLEGGVQEATQFVKFIPVEVLETIGKYEQSRFINAEGKSSEEYLNLQIESYKV
jgi:hypothetical protein